MATDIAKFTEFSGRSFKHPDDGQHDVDNNLNHDCNFYNNINYKCNYNTEQQCDAYVDDVHGLSIIHFNARSLNAIFFLNSRLPRRTCI